MSASARKDVDDNTTYYIKRSQVERKANRSGFGNINSSSSRSSRGSCPNAPIRASACDISGCAFTSGRAGPEGQMAFLCNLCVIAIACGRGRGGACRLASSDQFELDPVADSQCVRESNNKL